MMSRSASPHRAFHASLSACILILAAGFSLAARGAEYGGGTGTREDPFLIRTAEEFALIGNTPADWDLHFKLEADIDLSAYDPTNLRMIGSYLALGDPANRAFHGSFDGAGRTISGFRYRDMRLGYVGLFQYVTGDIRNLHLVGATIIADGVGAGALVGYQEKGEVTDCSVTGADVSGNESVGALVGVVDAGVHRCWSEGQVAGGRYVGGLVGRIGGGTVSRSYSKAAVVGNESVGGLLGGASTETALVDSCYAAGPVDGAAYAGGLVGHLVAGTVFRSYSRGKVTSTDAAGGLVGYQRALARVFGSVWDTESSGQTTSVGGLGKTTVEMKAIDTYLAENWDFNGTWAICAGISYPILLWQIPLGDLRCPDGVDFIDFVRLAENWRHRNCGAANWSCDGADLDQSGAVDPRDLALFAANWLAGIEW